MSSNCIFVLLSRSSSVASSVHRYYRLSHKRILEIYIKRYIGDCMSSSYVWFKKLSKVDWTVPLDNPRAAMKVSIIIGVSIIVHSCLIFLFKNNFVTECIPNILLHLFGKIIGQGLIVKMMQSWVPLMCNLQHIKRAILIKLARLWWIKSHCAAHPFVNT